MPSRVSLAKLLILCYCLLVYVFILVFTEIFSTYANWHGKSTGKNKNKISYFDFMLLTKFEMTNFGKIFKF